MENLILMTDSYKLSHFQQFPEHMVYMFDYIESRGGPYGYTIFFGLQYYLTRYLSIKITAEMVAEAANVASWHGVPFNKAGWDYIVTKHQGKLPLRIRAVPEGAVIPNHQVLVTVESLDAKVPWLVGWVETLLMKIWYPTTVATFSFKIHQMIEAFLVKTSDNVVTELPFKLHDFGYRGTTSEESAGIGGMAHLLNFLGTDTLAGLVYAQKYYQAIEPGYSVPASEHSTMTAWGKTHEVDAYRNMLAKHTEYPVVSIVADSYNYWKAVDELFSLELRAEILARKGNTVIRPDSGDPITNVLYTLQVAEKAFGYEVNSKGYKVLHKIRILQGDGINENTIYDILQVITHQKGEDGTKGYSAENIVFGCGGALLQGNSQSSINRDTHKFAMKCAAIGIENDGKMELREVFKNPITDKGKVSKKGRLDLILKAGKLETVKISDLPLNSYHQDTVLELVFENGDVVKTYTWDEIKENETLFTHDFPTGLARER